VEQALNCRKRTITNLAESLVRGQVRSISRAGWKARGLRGLTDFLTHGPCIRSFYRSFRPADAGRMRVTWTVAPGHDKKSPFFFYPLPSPGYAGIGLFVSFWFKRNDRPATRKKKNQGPYTGSTLICKRPDSLFITDSDQAERNSDLDSDQHVSH